MRGATKIFQLIIILLQGSFAGVLFGQIVHLFASNEPLPFFVFVVSAMLAILTLLIFFFRKTVRQYLLRVGNIVWLHYLSIIIYAVILSLHLLAVLFNFEGNPLILHTFQLGTLIGLAIIVGENYVLHLGLLQNVYADLLQQKRMSPLVKNITWLSFVALFAALSLYVDSSAGRSFIHVLSFTLYAGTIITICLALVKLKVLSFLKALAMPEEQLPNTREKAPAGFGNYFALERDLLKALQEAGSAERQLLYAKIRQIPLIDKLAELEGIKDRYFPDDKELESTIHFLHKLNGNLGATGVQYDPDAESSILEIRAQLRLAVKEGNPLLIQKLLNDSRPEVKKAAIFATINFNEASFIPALVNFLKDHEYAFAASEALFEKGDPCLPYLRAAKYRNKENSFFIDQCLQLVERFKTEDARDFLLEMLNEPQKIFQYRAAIALLKNAYPLTGLQKTQIIGFIESLIALVAIQRGIRLSIEKSQEQLLSALVEEEKEKRKIVDQLLMAFLPAGVHRLLASLLEKEPDESRESVFSIIDLFFPLSIRAKCKILMGNGADENIAPALQNEYLNEQVYFNYSSQEDAIRRILKMDYGQIGFWLRACGLKTLPQLPGQQVSLLVLSEIFNKNPLLQEVACEVLYHLNYDYYFLQLQRLPAERAKTLKLKIENNKLLNENRDIEENQLLFDKVLALRSFPMFRDFSFEQLARMTDLFSEICFDGSKSIVKQDPYQHNGYWLVMEGKFTLQHWGEESIKAREGDIIDMSLLIETDPNSLFFYSEGAVKVYFIEYFTLNKLILKAGYPDNKIIYPKTEQLARHHLV